MCEAHKEIMAGGGKEMGGELKSEERQSSGLLSAGLWKDGGADGRGDFLHDGALNTHCWFGASKGVI